MLLHGKDYYGNAAGYFNGEIYLWRSYSTEDIASGAFYSGGITGSEAGRIGSSIDIRECYGTGKYL